jgi:primosomal protein N' (replication factor Y)
VSEATVQVVVDAPRHAGLAAALDYSCERALDPGSLVRVPLGRREVAGIVWRGVDALREPGTALRPVAQQLDSIAALGPHWMALVEFAASYYQRSMGEVALAALPAELRRLSAAQLASRVRRSQRVTDRASTPPLPASPMAV